MAEPYTRTHQTRRHQDGRSVIAGDEVVVEEPLEIRLAGEALAVTMRTPGHDEELAAGFALTEGLVDHPEDLEAVRPCSEAEWGNLVELELVAEVPESRSRRAAREMFLSSSCGLCGKESIDRIRQHLAPLANGPEVDVALLEKLPEKMLAKQGAFAATGGLHAAALFRKDGRLSVLREDVGRHNAVDKVLGHELLLGRLPLSDGILLVSGRLSFEIVQKAARAGVPLLCAVSAPSSLAIDLAAEVGMTLVGFLRSGRMNVYTDAPGRLSSGSNPPGGSSRSS